MRIFFLPLHSIIASRIVIHRGERLSPRSLVFLFSPPRRGWREELRARHCSSREGPLCNRIQAARVYTRACVRAACTAACVPHDHRGVVDELRVPGICPAPATYPRSPADGPAYGLPYGHVCSSIGFPREQVANVRARVRSGVRSGQVLFFSVATMKTATSRSVWRIIARGVAWQVAVFNGETIRWKRDYLQAG